MPSVLRAPQLSRHGFAHGFSTRQGGVSSARGVSSAPYASLDLAGSVGDQAVRVAENRRRFAEQVGYAPEQLFELNQVHGNQVRVVRTSDAPEVLRQQDGDGLVADAGLAIGVRTADCLPLLLADPVTRAVAALHVGWRGAAAGVVPAGLEALRAVCQAPPERLLAAIFPHIRACCFEVGPDVAQILTQAAHGAVVVESRPEAHVELARLVRAQLMAAGVLELHIDDVAGCTRCDAERFFSFRRDGQASGRHLAVIVAG